MTNAKHTFTPGPWKTDGSEITNTGKSILTRICLMPHYGNGRSETGEANARLIAAAPELLEALKSVVDDLTYGTVGRWKGIGSDKLRAAIAKAEGK